MNISTCILSFFSLFSLFFSISSLHLNAVPHWHCQHLLIIIRHELFKHGRQMTWRDGRKDVCIPYMYTVYVCMCVWVCAGLKRHWKSDMNRWQAAGIILLLIYPCVHGCALHTCMCILCLHMLVPACVQCTHECVCTWMNVWWCEDMSSSRWNALTDLKQGPSHFHSPSWRALSEISHRIKFRFHHCYTQLDPLPAFLYPVLDVWN